MTVEACAPERMVTVSVEQLGCLLRSLDETQARRAGEYANLSASFHQLLKDQNELAYRRTLAESTSSFQHSSSEVRAIISVLESSGEHGEVRSLLQDMQRKEQAKLKFTLILQALRASGSQGKFTWQQAASEADSELDDVQLVTEGAAQGARGCGCGASKAQLEPTEDEFNAAVKEATQELQTVVTDINGILEELQYIKEDLPCC